MKNLREENEELSKWLNQNRHTLQQKYRNQYIAYNLNGLIAHGPELSQVLESARSSGESFTIYFFPRRTADIVILPIRLRSISRHESCAVETSTS
jgi:hypothetical protein